MPVDFEMNKENPRIVKMNGPKLRAELHQIWLYIWLFQTSK